MSKLERGRYNFYRSFIWNVIHYRLNRYPCHISAVEAYKIKQVRDWRLSIFVLAYMIIPPALFLIIDFTR